MTERKGPDWKALAAAAQPRRRSVRLCLRGDLALELEGAVAAGAVSDELRAEVEAGTVDFVVAGLTRAAYKKLENEHPDPDGAPGWNAESFPEALVRACLVSPVVEAEDPLFDVLTSGQVEALFEAAFVACNEVDDRPLLRRG